jgi:sulfur carrier protein ThiS
MQVNVNLVNDNKKEELDVADNSTPFDALKMLEIAPDTVIVTKNDKPIPIDSILEAGDDIAIIRVVSGG